MKLIVSRLRYKLAYFFMETGLRMIPNPFVREQFALANKLAAEVVLWQDSVEEENEGFPGGDWNVSN